MSVSIAFAFFFSLKMKTRDAHLRETVYSVSNYNNWLSKWPHNYSVCKAALNWYSLNIMLRVCSKPPTVTIKLLGFIIQPE